MFLIGNYRGKRSILYHTTNLILVTSNLFPFVYLCFFLLFLLFRSAWVERGADFVYVVGFCFLY
ncbi:hypothetical protein CI102_9567 [Trichoderma harzianum]|uniref:Uncharacterized protein n=1 Tax=Trichoderma harzianum CBS 226.95 TaxID=983964 RepID=A0A2T4AKM9_TRIHA|nr:hypothetical protein M431DRAFT_345664 [Trichoderma harzianum CBS 226.95]PKK46596.1 hypothetical protein CI102_9567 [Trichoderma harzianum]PTB57616.1 hypothetical protein M431DRAFT_345664 [Trichoderma harzianum CBS 226.95]